MASLEYNTSMLFAMHTLLLQEHRKSEPRWCELSLHIPGSAGAKIDSIKDSSTWIIKNIQAIAYFCANVVFLCLSVCFQRQFERSELHRYLLLADTKMGILSELSPPTLLMVSQSLNHPHEFAVGWTWD